MCSRAGLASDTAEVICKPGPAALAWGEVLVSMQFASINPADMYTIRTGGMYGDQQTQIPFVCGHDGVGVVEEVCPVTPCCQLGDSI